MVFQTLVNLVRARGPDQKWRKRKIFRLASHFFGRRRNCYTIAIRHVLRAMVFSTKARRLKKDDMRELWWTRINGGCRQYNLTAKTMTVGLERSNVMLNLKSIADLAAWEPRSFEVLAAIAREKVLIDGQFIRHETAATGEDLDLDNIFLRGKLYDDDGGSSNNNN